MTPTDHPYAGLEPQELWRHFALLNQTPRPSGLEDAVLDRLKQIADEAGTPWEQDAAGNLIIRVPARGDGNPTAPTVSIQSHVDMVCEKRPDVVQDFTTDPIHPRREGDLITATGTTLGADNGIGVAAALAVLTTPGLQHGPLELLFTVQEETGLHGAMDLNAELLSATQLINLDPEDPDELTVGCAGGAGTTLYLPVTWEDTASESDSYQLTVSGLKGGHSGVQIHEPLANAIKLLTEALSVIQGATEASGSELRLASLSGGTAHNAIPRDAIAYFVAPPGAAPAIAAALLQVRDSLSQTWLDHEPNFALDLRPSPLPAQVMSQASGAALLQLLSELPHGVLTMSHEFPGKVETSSNLCTVETGASEIAISTSTRSFVDEELKRVQTKIATLGSEVGARSEVRDGYPGWEPDADSQLLQTTKTVYEEVMGKPAQVQVIHAGLECGVIVSKKPGMEAISFGPLIRGAHTPEESVTISSTLATWKLLTALLTALS